MWLFCFCRWEAAATANDGWYQRHPVIHAKPAHLRVPLGIHGDDAGVHGSNQVLVLTWGGVASKLPTLDSRLAFSMVRVADVVAGRTLKTLLDVLVWSFQVCVLLGQVCCGVRCITLDV